jgi:predicted transcriptional regulator
MERKSAKELIKRILKSVSDAPKSIHEIAKDCESNWESIKVYLESLKDAGVLHETEISNKRVFSLAQCEKINKNGNYFDLPIKSEDEKLIDSLFFKIREKWKQKTGMIPGRIQVQKTLARINKECSLNLPIGWYLFGPVCAKPYDPVLQYEFGGLNPKIETCVTTVVSRYSIQKTASELKLLHYNEENHTLYKTKEILFSLLSSASFSKKYIHEINNQLYTLLKNSPPIFDKVSKELVNDFVGLVLQMINTLSDEDLKLVKNDIYQSFNEIWKLIALYNYFSDLEPYYVKNFSKEIELKHFITEMNMQKMEVIEYLKYLNDLLPHQPEPDDETYRKIKSILTSIHEAPIEEQKKREEFLEQKKKELGHEKFQDWLIEQFGLQ